MFKLISRNSFIKTSLTKPITRTALSSSIINTTQKMPLLTINNSISESLSKNEIFPDVLDKFEPNGLLTISYGDSNDVALGNKLSIDSTQSLPETQFTFSNTSNQETLNHIKDDLFTLVLTDPDAPSRTDKKWSEYLHYIKTNIKLDAKDGESFLSSSLSNGTGDEILEYQGPAPPQGTGKHRYVFVLLKQLNGELKVDGEQLKKRINWGYGVPATGLKRFASENSLEPWAINFFYAENK